MFYFIGLGVLAMSLLVAMSWRRVVPTNKIHVVQSRGAMYSYGRGEGKGNVYYHVPSPIPFFGVDVTELPIDIFKIPLDGYEAYDAAKVPFSVDVIAFFQIEDALTASQRIGDYDTLKNQLTDTLRGAVRKVLAGHPIEKIMGIRNELGSEFFEEVQDDVKNWGVKLNSIEFMDISDAQGTKVVTNIMDKERTTIERDSRMKVAENEKAAEIAEIEAQEATSLRDVQRKETVAVRDEENKQKVQIAAAETRRKEMSVLEVETVRRQEIAKDQARVSAEAAKQVMLLQAEAEALSAKTNAEGYKDAKILEGAGEASKTSATGTAEADIIKAKGLAEAEAKEKMAEALQKMNDAAINAELVKAMVEINRAKYEGLAEAYKNANVKIVTSGKGANLFGVELNAENGADLAMFIDQLPDSLKEKATTLAETLSKKVQKQKEEKK